MSTDTTATATAKSRSSDVDTLKIHSDPTTSPIKDSPSTTTHRVKQCMDTIIPTLSILPVPLAQAKDLGPVFAVHNAFRQSMQCIARYMETYNVDTSITEIRNAAKECYEWVKFYMPHLHHHHHHEDEYWFPAYRKVLIDAGVASADVNAVFDQWEAEHKELDQREQEMTRDLETLTQIKEDMTRDIIQSTLSTCQRSLDSFATFVSDHLKAEETYWVDQFITQNRITDKQAKQLGETFGKTKLSKLKAKELGHLLGYTMSPLGKEKEQEMLKTLLPFPVRAYYNWFARKSYLKSAPRLYLIAHGHISG